MAEISMSNNKEIHIAAAIITDEQDRLLLVRKRGTRYFMQPGGKIEPGETSAEALKRELEEELKIEVSLSSLSSLGRFQDVAANEPGYHLIADVFRLNGRCENISPAAEIEEAVWVSLSEIQDIDLAPLTRNTIIPLIAS